MEEWYQQSFATGVAFFLRKQTRCALQSFRKRCPRFKEKSISKENSRFSKNKKTYSEKRQQKQKLLCFQKITSKGFRKNVVFLCFESLLFKKRRKRMIKRITDFKNSGLFRKNPSTTHLFNEIFDFELLFGFWFQSNRTTDIWIKKVHFPTEFQFPWTRTVKKSNKQETARGPSPCLVYSIDAFAIALLACSKSEHVQIWPNRCRVLDNFLLQKFWEENIFDWLPFFFKGFLRKKETRTLSEIDICISFQKRKILRKMFSNSKIKNLLILLNPFRKKSFLSQSEERSSRGAGKPYDFPTIWNLCLPGLFHKLSTFKLEVASWANHGITTGKKRRSSATTRFLFRFNFCIDESWKKLIFWPKSVFPFLEIFS